MLRGQQVMDFRSNVINLGGNLELVVSKMAYHQWRFTFKPLYSDSD